MDMKLEKAFYDRTPKWLKLGITVLLAICVIIGAFCKANFVKSESLHQTDNVPDARLLYTDTLDRYMLNIRPNSYNWYLFDDGNVKTLTSGKLPSTTLPEIAATELEKVQIVFSSKPSSFTVSYKPADTDDDFMEIPADEMTILLPNGSGKYTICIDAKWSNANGTHLDGVATYMFTTESYINYAYAENSTRTARVCNQ